MSELGGKCDIVKKLYGFLNGESEADKAQFYKNFRKFLQLE